jgi:hypothetical protein
MRVTAVYLKAGSSSLKRGTGKIFKFSELVSDYKESSRNLIFNFLHKKAAKYCENHQSSY